MCLKIHPWGLQRYDIVIGNPPWVRLHNIAPASRLTLRQRYRVYRDAAWERGAAGAHAGSGFAGQVDLASLFVERSLALLRPEGTLALLLPAKLWRSLAGGGVRRLLLEEARIRAVEDWTGGPAAFDAAVYPSLVVAAKNPVAKAEDADIPADAWAVPTADELKSLCDKAVREIEEFTKDAKKYEAELVSRNWRV